MQTNSRLNWMDHYTNYNS